MEDEIDIESMRQALLSRREAIDADGVTRNEAAATVELDPTRTGRLTRMDALQGQAMAQAAQARIARERQRITAALARIDAEEYGDCAHCDDPIGRGRLRADPATPLCIHCAERNERR